MASKSGGGGGGRAASAPAPKVNTFSGGAKQPTYVRSASGKVAMAVRDNYKPVNGERAPSANELANYYTTSQLRAARAAQERGERVKFS